MHKEYLKINFSFKLPLNVFNNFQEMNKHYSEKDLLELANKHFINKQINDLKKGFLDYFRIHIDLNG